MARNDGEQAPPGLGVVLLPGETVVVAVHAHWAKLAEPVATTFGALLLVAWADSNLTLRTQAIGTILWWGFFVVVARLLWELLQWNHNWFVATDKRLLLRFGLITHKVAMMPLSKVTDMSYVRTVPGQLLGYGKFVLESAGQDQALREITWVPHPDRTYRSICAEIFTIDPAGFEDGELLVEDFDGTDGPDDAGGARGARGPGSPSDGPKPGPRTPPTAAGSQRPKSRPGGAGSPRRDDDGYPDVPSTHNPIQDRLDSYSRAVPIKPREGGQSIYESEDIKRRRRSDNTGPIWPVKRPRN